MAPLLEDPRIRQNWNQISHNVETATETAAAGIWTFTHDYINPCFASFTTSINSCSESCLGNSEERENSRRRRERSRTRGRAEYSFDFYDDWEEEESSGGGLLGWGNDELDRLLAGSGASGSHAQPGRKRGMSYGTGKGKGRVRGKTIDGLPDPTIIPSTNPLGFLQRLPWKMGGTLRYKPSAADLQEHPVQHTGGLRTEFGAEEEGEALLSGDHSEEDGDLERPRTRARPRSSTTGSGDTSDSFRSRGDLFLSDGEDDAVPLDDEFAMVLERRTTGSQSDDKISGKIKTKGKRPAGFRKISRTFSRTTQDSSRSQPSPLTRGSSASDIREGELSSPISGDHPSMTDLQREEERVRLEEEAEVEKKREAATRLAGQRGLSVPEEEDPLPEIKSETSTPGEPPASEESQTEEAEIENTEEATVEDVVESKDFVPAKLPRF